MRRTRACFCAGALITLSPLILPTVAGAHPSTGARWSGADPVLFVESRRQPADFKAAPHERVRFVTVDPTQVRAALAGDSSPLAAGSSGCSPRSGRTVTVRSPGGDDVVLDPHRVMACRSEGLEWLQWIGRARSAGATIRSLSLMSYSGQDGAVHVLGSAQTPDGVWTLSPTTDASTNAWTTGDTSMTEPYAAAAEGSPDPTQPTGAPTTTTTSVPTDGEPAASDSFAQHTSTRTIGSSSPRQVDVLFVFANGLTQEQANKYTLLSINSVMHALDNSGIDLKVWPVAVKHVAHDEITPMSDELRNLWRDGDGDMDEALTWRDQYQADTVALLVPQLEPGACGGLGYVPLVGEGDDTKGFLDMITGGCDGTETPPFAHELGHNLGAMHDPETVKAQSNGVLYEGSYPWAYGNYVSGKGRDIMAYNTFCNPGCTDQLQYADPDDDFMDFPGVRSGTATRDADRAIDDTAWAVSQYRPVRQSNDRIWFGNADRTHTSFTVNQSTGWTPPFPGSPHDVEAPYTPITGDFDGDGRADQFWYYAGRQPDHLWYFESSRGTYTPYGPGVNGAYRPVTGDFDGDGRDDIFWYGPGSAPDHVWWGQPRSWGTAFGDQQTTTTVNGTYFPLSGDFDGDGFDDVLWYSPGSAPDSIWWGGPDRAGLGSASSSRAISATYDPVAGDFDRDGAEDVLWYGPGATADYVWWGARGARTIGPATQTDTAISGTYRPAAGNFDGQAGADVLWYGPDSTADYVWWGQTSRSAFGPGNSTLTSADGDADPTAGDFDGDGRDDVYLFELG